MATEQIVRGDHKETGLREMVTHASNMLRKRVGDGTFKAQQNGTVAGAIENNAPMATPMILDQVHEWVPGKFTIKPPQVIHNKDLPAVFLHHGFSGHPHIRSPSRAAVMYYQQIVDENDDDEDEDEDENENDGFLHTYVLAWSVNPGRATDPNNKVYVTAGPGIPLKNNEIDWGVIERRLNASGNTSDYRDPITKISARAEITAKGNEAALGASFK